jgi:hypothetical protein
LIDAKDHRKVYCSVNTLHTLQRGVKRNRYGYRPGPVARWESNRNRLRCRDRCTGSGFEPARGSSRTGSRRFRVEPTRRPIGRRRRTGSGFWQQDLPGLSSRQRMVPCSQVRRDLELSPGTPLEAWGGFRLSIQGNLLQAPNLRCAAVHIHEKLTVLDMRENRVVWTVDFPVLRSLLQAAWSPDSRQLAYVSASGIVDVWDLAAGRVVEHWTSASVPL